MNLKFTLSLLYLMLLTGCHVGKKAIYSAGGAAIGGGLGYTLFDKNPLAVGAGAAAGAILSSTLYGEDEKALAASYNEGYIKASSDSIKRQYWLKQAMEWSNSSDGRLNYYTFPADNLMPDGRILVDHTVTVPIIE